MKSFILVASLLILAAAAVRGIEREEDCNCWDDFVPELHVDHYHCRGLKNKRLFDCNEAAPPLCKCTVNGQEISLDLGETHCAGVKNAGKECNNLKDFDEYFKENPHRKLHH